MKSPLLQAIGFGVSLFLLVWGSGNFVKHAPAHMAIAGPIGFAFAAPAAR